MVVFFMSHRKLRVSKNLLKNCDGSACVRLGSSYYLAGVKAEIGVPLLESPSDGKVIITVDLPQICGANARQQSLNSTNYVSTFAASTVNEILQSDGVLDAKSLVIREGEAVWVLKVHIVCMAYDGGFIDAALAAAVGALEDTVLPTVSWDPTACWYRRLSTHDDTSDISGSDAVYISRRFKLLSRPLAITFLCILDSEWIVDPSRDEESLGSTMTLCRANHGWITIRLGGSEVYIQSVHKWLQDEATKLFILLEKAIQDADDAQFELLQESSSDDDLST